MIPFSQKPKRSAILTGMISILLVLFLLSFIGSPFVLHLIGLSKINGTVFFISRMLYWICLVLVWFYATRSEKQPLLIWQEKKYHFSIYIISVAVIFIILLVGLFAIQRLLLLANIDKKSTELSVIIDILRTNKLLLVFTVLTAGIVEELIFRGYLLPRLEIIFKSPFWAITISSLLFGSLHYKYGTVINIAGPVFIGFVFSYYYWKYRNIKILILSHIIWDLIGILILVKQH